MVSDVEGGAVSRTLYREVYEALRSAIRSGEYAVGDRLPRDAELMARFDVSSVTVKRALTLLRDEGYLSRRPRHGTFVVSREAGDATPSPLPQGGLLIGCVLTDFDETFGTRMLAGLIDAGQDSSLVVRRSLGDGEREDMMVRALAGAGARALILQPSSSEFVPPAVLELITRGFPVVILDRVYDGLPVSSVCSDNVTAGREATDYLFSLGHERLGLISSDSDVSTLRDRRTGFIAAHAHHHLPHDPANEFRATRSTVPGSYATPDDDVRALTGYLQGRPGLQGVVVTEYHLAVLVQEAAHELGIRVPEDLSIVCFDHPGRFFDRGSFEFTHIEQDETAMGQEAVRIAHELINDRSKVERVALETKLVVGGSTAKVG